MSPVLLSTLPQCPFLSKRLDGASVQSGVCLSRAASLPFHSKTWAGGRPMEGQEPGPADHPCFSGVRAPPHQPGPPGLLWGLYFLGGALTLARGHCWQHLSPLPLTPRKCPLHTGSGEPQSPRQEHTPTPAEVQASPLPLPLFRDWPSHPGAHPSALSPLDINCLANPGATQDGPFSSV